MSQHDCFNEVCYKGTALYIDFSLDMLQQKPDFKEFSCLNCSVVGSSNICNLTFMCSECVLNLNPVQFICFHPILSASNRTNIYIQWVLVNCLHRACPWNRMIEQLTTEITEMLLKVSITLKEPK